MKTGIIFLFICFLLIIITRCIVFDFDNTETDNEPNYKAKIAWNSGLYSNDDQSITVDGDGVYFYERPPGYTKPGRYNLTRLNAKTGKRIWRGNVIFDNIVFCQPAVIDGYVYVFLRPNIILCFNKETGKHTATVKASIDNKDFDLEANPAFYRQYLYLSISGSYLGTEYFTRMNVNAISHGNPGDLQAPALEILWQPDKKGNVTGKPVVYSNTVYTSTYSAGYMPIELAGFDVDTKEMVYHISFGGPDDGDIPFPETGVLFPSNPILINDGVLYYLNWTISAWDLASEETIKKPLYYHTFTYNIPEPQWYLVDGSLQAVYYRNKIFYTSRDSYIPNRVRNIHCIDAKTGTLVWNDIAKDSPSLQTNPVIAHGRLYTPQFTGLRVYEAETGELIGVDRSFCGAALGRNVLYEDEDYMICVKKNKDSGYGKVVAVYVGD